MRPLPSLSFAAFVVLSASACGAPSSSFPAGGGPPNSVCAADTRWFTSVMGDQPRKSIVFSLDVMRRNRAWGTALAKNEPGGHFVTSEFSELLPTFEEIYLFDGPPPGSSGEVVIVRKASNREPCTVKGSFGGTPPKCRYGAPARLPSGVLEYPGGNGSLFAFADGTWVRVPDWMSPRFRATFSSSASPPPAIAGSPTIAMQACALRPTPVDLADTDTLGNWVGKNVGADAASVSYIAAEAEPGDADLVFAFPTPALAARAEADVRAQCGQGQCPNLFSSSAAGTIARYRVRISSPFR